MNNNEVKNVENKQNDSLMRKTKAQLVEIILRKDSIENNLRADIKSTEAKLKKAETKINAMQYDYSELKNDYTDICDEKVFVECDLKKTINNQRGVICILTIIFVINAIVNIALYFI